MKHLLLSALLLSTSISAEPEENLRSNSGKRGYDDIYQPTQLKSVRGQGCHAELARWKESIAQAIQEGDCDVCAIMLDSGGRPHSVTSYVQADVYSSQIKERRSIRAHAPDRSNLNKRVKFVEDELGQGLHQCSGMTTQDLDTLQAMQDKLNRIIAHAQRVRSDSQVILAEKLGYAQPLGTPIHNLTILFSNLFGQLKPILESIYLNLNQVPDFDLSIGPKTALNGLRNNLLPETIGILENYLELFPRTDSMTYQQVSEILTSISIRDHDLVSHRKGGSGTAGLTRLESIIGGYDYGSSDTFYPQQPSLFNVILSGNLNDTTRQSLIELRQNLIWASNLITKKSSTILSDETILITVCENNSSKLELARVLLNQHSLAHSSGMTHQTVSDNLNCWQSHKVFESLNGLRSPSDYQSIQFRFQQLQDQFDQTRSHFLQLKDRFLDRATSLSPLVKILKTLDFSPSLDLKQAANFSDALDGFLSSAPGRITLEILQTNFGQFFHESGRTAELQRLVDYKNSQLALDQESLIIPIVSSIVSAHQAHTDFMAILAEIRSAFSILQFKPTSEIGIKKTKFFLTEILQPRNHYVTLDPKTRADVYAHGLAALQDPGIWEENCSDDAINLFCRALNAYEAATRAIKLITLPSLGEETTHVVPGFRFGDHQEPAPNQTNTGFPPPPPPPPGGGSHSRAYTWARLTSDVAHHLATHPETKDFIVGTLQGIIQTNLTYADATLPTASQLKTQLNLGSTS